MGNGARDRKLKYWPIKKPMIFLLLSFIYAGANLVLLPATWQVHGAQIFASAPTLLLSLLLGLILSSASIAFLTESKTAVIASVLFQTLNLTALLNLSAICDPLKPFAALDLVLLQALNLFISSLVIIHYYQGLWRIAAKKWRPSVLTTYPLFLELKHLFIPITTSTLLVSLIFYFCLDSLAFAYGIFLSSISSFFFILPFLQVINLQFYKKRQSPPSINRQWTRPFGNLIHGQAGGLIAVSFLIFAFSLTHLLTTFHYDAAYDLSKNFLKIILLPLGALFALVSLFPTLTTLALIALTQGLSYLSFLSFALLWRLPLEAQPLLLFEWSFLFLVCTPFAYHYQAKIEKNLPWRKLHGLFLKECGNAFLSAAGILLLALFAIMLLCEIAPPSYFLVSIQGIFIGLFFNLFFFPVMLQKISEIQTSKLSFELFLDSLDDVTKNFVKSQVTEKKFAAGEIIFSFAEARHEVLFIKKGMAEIMFDDLRKRRKMHVKISLTAPDCIGEYNQVVGPFNFYSAHALTDVTVRSLPHSVMNDILRTNSHTRNMFHHLFFYRTRLSNNRILIHNAKLFAPFWKVINTIVPVFSFLLFRFVLMKLLRIRTEYPYQKYLSDTRGNLLVIANHHYEFDAGLTAFACCDSGFISASRQPYFIANAKFWLKNPLISFIAKSTRNIIIQAGIGRGVEQFGFEMMKSLFHPYNEATIYIFPWARTRPGSLTKGTSMALQWAITNLDCHIVPCCMIGLGKNPYLSLALSIFKPLRWRVGKPVSTKKLREELASLEEIEKFLAQEIIDLSQGTLKI